jgi:hypothetical protein
MEESKTTYLLTMKDGDLKKITIPSSWKLTFGCLFPGSKGIAPSGGAALRVYDGTQQKAVFTDVESFRDMGIQIEERITTTKQETYTKQGDGAGKAVVVEAQIHEWRNPDQPVATKTQQPVTQLRVINLDD